MAERLSRQQGREFEDDLLLNLLNKATADPTFRGQLGSMSTPAPEGLAELGPDPDSMSGIMLDIMNLDPTILQDPNLLEALRGQDILAPAAPPEPEPQRPAGQPVKFVPRDPEEARKDREAFQRAQALQREQARGRR